MAYIGCIVKPPFLVACPYLFTPAERTLNATIRNEYPLPMGKGYSENRKDAWIAPIRQGVTDRLMKRIAKRIRLQRSVKICGKEARFVRCPPVPFHPSQNMALRRI